MKKERSIKQRLVSSILALVMLFTSLVGTTFAWFTDSVTSAGNKINTGTLKVDLLHKVDDDWISVKENPEHKIFDYKKWEPGYTRVETLKVANNGSLALQYKLSVEVAEGTALTGKNGENLADVIDVYTTYADTNATGYSEITSSSDWVHRGTLTEVMQNPSTFLGGELLPTGKVLTGTEAATTAVGSQTLKIALHMQESAGNEYQELKVGDIYVNLIATQWDSEMDSFGGGYDAGATFPELNISGIYVDVTTAFGVVTNEATVTGIGISAVIPAGVAVEGNTNKLGLSVKEKDQSEANVTLNDGEALRSLDVHMAGVSKNNTVPMLITVEKAMKAGLNIGNYTLYHVEDGQTVAMSAVSTLAELDTHNEFYYDPATGDVVLAMATFSEVAFVAEPSKWEGKRDYSWYTGAVATADGEGEIVYTIANADQLAAFGAIVGGMAKGIEQDSFSGKTVKLIADINIGDTNDYYKDASENGIVFYPIGYNSSDGEYEKTGVAVTTGFYNFCGTFDGNGHTVSNFYHNTWEMKGDNEYYDRTLQYFRDGMGLFGRVYGGTVKNLTVRNFSSDGEYTTTGVIAAYADGATFENIAIFGCNPRVYNIGNGGIVGCVGWYAKEANLDTTFKNITVDNSNKISALWGSYDVACGGIVGQYYPTSGQTSAGKPENGNIYFDNCHISAQLDVYNDVCGNYQYYAYRYAGMLIGSVRENVTIDGHVYPKMSDIDAKNCTVHFGTWNDYYYCEFEKNGHPSYSGPDDYKFSRIPHSEINFTDSNGNGIIDTEGEKASVTGCKHTHTAAEDNQCVYLQFNNLVTGYGWGVTTKVVGELEGVTILNREVADSVVKFTTADNFTGSYMNGGKSYTLGELFKAATWEDKKLEIKSDKVSVTVSPVGENSTVSAKFALNTTDWTKSTLTFSGTGKANITITDYYFCTPTTITVDITDRVSEEKFDVVLHNGDFLHRVGNQNAVALNKLFQAKDGAVISDVQVAVTTTGDVTATHTQDTANWANGTLQFSGTGLAIITITDNNYCTPTELYLEVVDATNVTGLSGTLTGNVVLLNDCGLSSLIVSGRNTVYGNGFTATYSGNGQYLNNGLKQGVVTVSENGTLDNLRIKAPIYPKAYLYYGTTSLGDYVQGGPYTTEGDKIRYHYQLSVVAASGNATISNCYIYGGRTNIFVNTGDVTIKDTILECGTVANVQIQSNSDCTITLENITTIQYQTNSTIVDTSKVMLGAGIIIGPETNDNPKIILKGSCKQYNWVTSDDASKVSSSALEMIIEGALNAQAYNHTINGKNASNLGIIYMNEYTATVTNDTGLPYALGSVEMKALGSTVRGQVYSVKNANESQIYSDYANADRTTANGLYQPQFKYSEDLGNQKLPDNGGDEFFYREGDTIKVMFPSGDLKEINLEAIVDIAKYSNQNLNLSIEMKDSTGNNITVSNGKVILSKADEYVVTYKVTDSFYYNSNGERINHSIEYSWNVKVSVSLKDVAIPNAEFEFVSANQIMYYTGSGSNVVQFIPFLAGLKIYDYNAQGRYLRFDGDTDYSKIVSVQITDSNFTGNKAYIEVKLVDGGVINIKFGARADSGGSTYSGKIVAKNNVVYYVTNSKTKTTTTTWTIDYYTFTGFNGVEISKGSKFNNCQKESSTPSGSFGTTIKYTVNYNANGGNCLQTLSYATSAAAAVTLPVPSRSGYSFKGWYTAASGGTRVGGAGDSYTPSANITLYAQWGEPLTITFDANGGNCSVNSVTTGGNYALPDASREGYTFIGWFDAVEGGNKIGDAGYKYSPNANITLYAHWLLPITVTYNANGGSCTTTNAVYKGEPMKLPAATTTQTGYHFAGWYTAASGGTRKGGAGDDYTPEADITLYAQWEKTAYKIEYSSSNTTSVNGPETAYYGDTVTVTVVYSNGQETAPTLNVSGGVSITSSGSGKNYTYTFTMPAQDVTMTITGSSCITPDTLITLADGTQVRVDSLKGDELLLVWNMETGKFDYAPIMFIDSDPETEYEVIKLYFSDGTEVKVIYEHGFWDYDLNKYVYLDRNAADYIGHTFAKQNGDTLEKVTLVDVVIETELTTAWSPVTAGHLCYFVNGMLSMPGGVGGLFNIFEVDPDTMTYDFEQIEKDIETYGLFTYEELNAICPLSEEMFNAAGGAYLKISIGKGNLTMEELIAMINRYSKYI